jgi:hypothetical protein
MNPMTQAVIGSVVRWGLALLAGHYASKGLSEGDMTQVTAAVTGGIALGWSIYQKYHGRQVTVTLGNAAGMSEQTAKALVANPSIPTPSVTTPANDVPVPAV